MEIFKLNKNLDTRALLVFQRLLRFFKTLNVISALVSGLSLAVLSFNEFHPTQSPAIRAAEGFLCSSSMTAVVSVVIATMLMFRYEGHDTVTRKDLLFAWSPLALLDLAILEFLLGLALWYTGKNNSWRSALVVTQLASLLVCAVAISAWMWQTMSQAGGLGRQEALLTAERTRTVEKRTT